MNEHEFRVGERVYLRGYRMPIMIINSIDGDYADCVWFDSDWDVHNYCFALNCLSYIDWDTLKPSGRLEMKNG